MKKILVFIITILLVTGCSNDQPYELVRNDLAKYQNLDSDMMNQLKNVLKEETTLDKDQKEKYKALMIKQYQHMNYQLVSEDINKDEAIINVEIEVYNYLSSLISSLEYKKENEEKFHDSDGNFDQSKFITYQLQQLKSVTARERYLVSYILKKENKTWEIVEYPEYIVDKLHGFHHD